MTALTEFERLESDGLWRESLEAQRRDVVLSFGEATLVLADKAGRPLTHWSLPAIARLNPGQRPALFSPDPDGGEQIEVEDDLMIDAIEKVRKTIARRRAHPGRLRLWIGLGIAAGVAAVAVLWLPGAAREQVLRTVPSSTRDAIDTRLTAQIEALTGRACTSPRGTRALGRLNLRVGGSDPVRVVPGELAAPLALPGGAVLLDRAMVALPEDPAAPAGHILTARMQAQAHDPLRGLLERAGPGALFELIGSGTLSDDTLAQEAATLISQTLPLPDVETVIEGFRTADVPVSAWARDVDVTGETVLPYLEADPFSPGQNAPLIGDGDWLALQSICEG